MRLIVAGFNRDVTEKDLKKVFSRYGVVRRATIWIDLRTGISKGFGFVEIKDEEDAKYAIKKLDGRLWHDNYLMVGKAANQRWRSQKE
jgi:RNA recognition motif-containing protein